MYIFQHVEQKGMTQHLIRQRAPKLYKAQNCMCPVRQSKSIAQADARKQALCSQRTSYAHRPRRRLSVRSGLGVLGYEADCQKAEAHQRRGKSGAAHQPFPGTATTTRKDTLDLARAAAPKIGETHTRRSLDRQIHPQRGSGVRVCTHVTRFKAERCPR